MLWVCNTLPGPSGSTTISTSSRQAQGPACLRAVLLWHGIGTAWGEEGSRQPAVGSSASHAPRLLPLRRLLPCRKAAGL